MISLWVISWTVLAADARLAVGQLPSPQKMANAFQKLTTTVAVVEFKS